MKNAIILHGKPGKEEYYSDKYPSASNSHWIPWLQKQLLIHDITAHTPEVSHSYNPHYETWKKEFERFDITPETILVGHSTGAGFIIRWLSENKKVTVGKVVLVAPYLDPDRTETKDFFDFTIDPDLVSRTNGLTLFYSIDDYKSIIKTVEIVKEKIENVIVKKFKNYGHFTLEEMKTVKFPELLEILL